MSALGSVEPVNVAVVTPREAAAREYLLSAKRPMTQQQLHELLDNTHALQAEFAVRHSWRPLLAAGRCFVFFTVCLLTLSGNPHEFHRP